ncbi:hypothetical protein JCM19241_5957 [Vibrio ishigakensis]|uniref:Uncharacterized protein n=1 Tax=Vibrio ishigakensis TaxID=1481914 RepID=A0A0B8QEM8_9VIBR|nr:hypothetical protein JCM19241_5957 [Vibrio ishigakensis]
MNNELAMALIHATSIIELLIPDDDDQREHILGLCKEWEAMARTIDFNGVKVTLGEGF